MLPKPALQIFLSLERGPVGLDQTEVSSDQMLCWVTGREQLRWTGLQPRGNHELMEFSSMLPSPALYAFLSSLRWHGGLHLMQRGCDKAAAWDGCGHFITERQDAADPEYTQW